MTGGDKRRNFGFRRDMENARSLHAVGEPGDREVEPEVAIAIVAAAVRTEIVLKIGSDGSHHHHQGTTGIGMGMRQPGVDLGLAEGAEGHRATPRSRALARSHALARD